MHPDLMPPEATVWFVKFLIAVLFWAISIAMLVLWVSYQHVDLGWWGWVCLLLAISWLNIFSKIGDAVWDAL